MKKFRKIVMLITVFVLVPSLGCFDAAYAEMQAPISAAENGGQARKVTEKPECEKYFGKLNGGAVVYAPPESSVEIYNAKLAGERRPPCSSFKIISSLTAIEHGIIRPDDSVRKWSGEKFWYEG